MAEVPAEHAERHSIFVTFEGGEGTGKSTQLMLLETRLKAAGRSVFRVREPGGTQLGEYVRRWVKGNSTATPLAEAMLFGAARANLVEKVIKPALARGMTVLSDRFADSTVAYQGFGRGLDVKTIKNLNQIATMGVLPDLTILLDLDPALANERTKAQSDFLPGKTALSSRIDSESELRFERESLLFHQRVKDGYLRLAGEEPERWLVLDGSEPPTVIADSIWNRFAELIGQTKASDS